MSFVGNAILNRAVSLLGLKKTSNGIFCSLLIRCSSMAYSDCISLPESVRGFTHLGDVEKDAFRKEFLLPSLRLECKQIPRILGCVAVANCSIRGLPIRVKALVNVPDSSDKLLLFDPAKFQKDNNGASVVDAYTKLFDHSPPPFDVYRLLLGYEHWSADACIRAILPENLNFSGFSQVGHIVHVNLRSELLPYKRVIGQVLLDKITTCKTVLNKLDTVETQFRVFKPDLLAGEESYLTEVREDKLRFKFDFSKVFWNPRLSTEHSIIAHGLPAGCVFYDCCAGVGPFVLPAARKGVFKVIANDLNPESVKWLKTNISLNRLEKANIEVHNLDAQQFIAEVIADDLLRYADECHDADTTAGVSSSLAPEESEERRGTKRRFEDETAGTPDVPAKVECCDTKEHQRGNPSVDVASTSESASRKPSSAHVVMNLPGCSLSFLPAFRGFLRKRIQSSSSTVSRKLSFPVIIHCHFFVSDTREESEVRRGDKWHESEAERLVRLHIRSEKIKIMEIRWVRNVAPRKDMYCVSFEILNELLFMDLPVEENEPIVPIAIVVADE